MEKRNFALVTLAQRGKRPPKQTLQRIVQLAQIRPFRPVTVNLNWFFTFGDRIIYSCSGGFGPTWKETIGADIVEDRATTTNTTIPTCHSQLRFVSYISFLSSSYGCAKMRCKDAVLPACYYFPRAAVCLIFSILACFDSESTHTHTSGQVLVLLVVEAGINCAAATLCSNNSTDAVSCM